MMMWRHKLSLEIAFAIWPQLFQIFVRRPSFLWQRDGTAVTTS